MKRSSRIRHEGAGADGREGSTIPWALMRQGPIAPTPQPFHTPLFVLCLLFLIVYADMVFRHLVMRRKSGILTLRAPAWTVTARFAWYYGAFIALALLWGGPMMGLATTLAFSGISVAIESRQIYQAIWNASRYAWHHRSFETVWIRYRESAIQVRSLSIDTLQGVHLDGSPVEIPTNRLHELTNACERSCHWALLSCQLTISRLSDLHRVRHLLTEPLGTLVRDSAPRALRIAFHDVDASWTRVDVSVVVEEGSTSAEALAELATASLRADGVTLPGDTARPHLRLVQIRRAA